MANDRTKWPGSWFVIRATLPRESEDSILGLMHLHGTEGAQTEPAGPGRVSLEGWFSDQAAARSAQQALAGCEGVRIDADSPQAITDPGWLEASLETRGPLGAGRFVVTDRPLAEGETAPGQRVIFLPPGRAFGTGEHDTTRMCLEWLDQLLVPGEAVFDLGTGSGILAIAAVQAGAGRVLAFDNDPAVIEVVEENLALNGLAGRIEVGAGSWQELAPADRFHLVLANIHRTALIRAARSLGRHLEPGGRAILSGFGHDDAPQVLANWRKAGFDLIGESRSGEWSALAVIKPS